MPEKCNIPPSEREKLLKQFESGIRPEEVEQVRRLFTQYLFYHRINRKSRLFLCTSCCNQWEAPYGASGFAMGRHNEQTLCPICGEVVTLKAVGRLGANSRYPSLHEAHNLVLLRKAPDGALQISAGRVVVEYEENQDIGFTGWDDESCVCFPNPTLEFYERRRYYMAPGRLQSWRRSDGVYNTIFGHQLYTTQWNEMKSAGEPIPCGSNLYPQPDDGAYFLLGWDVLPDTSMRYSAVEQTYDTNSRLYSGVVSYLAYYTHRPQLEMLVKLGHDDVIEELMDDGGIHGRLVNWRGKSPQTFFRLSKRRYRTWTENGGSLTTLEWYQTMPEDTTAEEFALFAKMKGRPELIRKVLKAANSHHISVRRLAGYLTDCHKAQLWVDYVSMGEHLQLDFQRQDVLLPKNLTERHDNAMKLVELESDAEKQTRYQCRKRELYRTYAMELDDYLIRVPGDMEEIVAEGKALQHCVGGYAKRHIEGKVTILFLRTTDAPDVPLVTIEMNGTALVQIHGFKNERDGAQDPRTKYKAFLDVWLAWVSGNSPRDNLGRPILKQKKVRVKTA